MSNYLLDDSSNILTTDTGDRLTWLGSGVSLVMAAGSYVFSGLAATLTKRATMVLRLKYRKH